MRGDVYGLRLTLEILFCRSQFIENPIGFRIRGFATRLRIRVSHFLTEYTIARSTPDCK